MYVETSGELVTKHS